ncbi:unnamed protein product [Gongylonema pulchrum]|uniref:Uncharacterized protein n=1 Tax=Gongylonema pulchrum TaxID=637853 RepID=A0A3P7NAM1_9BILA|nr:unnamed protein product [Gongylonema pulchrum]
MHGTVLGTRSLLHYENGKHLALEIGVTSEQPLAETSTDLGSGSNAVVGVVAAPQQTATADGHYGLGSNTVQPSRTIETFFRSSKPEDPQASRLFSFLQVLTACFAGFAHGGNDVRSKLEVRTKGGLLLESLEKNCISAVPPLFLVIKKCYRETYSGFAIEFGAAVTVLVSSKFGLPISSTQCKQKFSLKMSQVGSVVAVGTVQASGSVKWSTFRNISLSWLVTLPVTGKVFIKQFLENSTCITIAGS